jgi:hypothetical protein
MSNTTSISQEFLDDWGLYTESSSFGVYIRSRGDGRMVGFLRGGVTPSSEYLDWIVARVILRTFS